MKANKAFCFPCIHFASVDVPGRTEETFTQNGFDRWHKDVGTQAAGFIKHACSKDHVAAVQSWLLYKENPVTIQERLDPHRGDIITANRQYFKILFSYARYFAVQELATRSVSEHDSGATNRGNWRELIDLSLKLHPDFEKLRQVVIRQFSINTDYLRPYIMNLFKSWQLRYGVR